MEQFLFTNRFPTRGLFEQPTLKAFIARRMDDIIYTVVLEQRCKITLIEDDATPYRQNVP